MLNIVIIIFILSISIIEAVTSFHIEMKLLLLFIQVGLIIYLWFRMRKVWKSNNNRQEFNMDCKESILKILGLYRHDWQNHMQLILGYTQLKKHDKILKYIDKINHLSKQQSIMSSLKNTDLSVFLLTIAVNYPMLSYEIEVYEELKTELDNETGGILFNYLKRYIELFNENIDGNIDHHLIISLTNLNGVIIVNLEYEGSTDNIDDKLKEINEDLKKDNGFSMVDIHNEKELIMELHFSL